MGLREGCLSRCGRFPGEPSETVHQCCYYCPHKEECYARKQHGEEHINICEKVERADCPETIILQCSSLCDFPD
jgi:hypothetical protein